MILPTGDEVEGGGGGGGFTPDGGDWLGLVVCVGVAVGGACLGGAGDEV